MEAAANLARFPIAISKPPNINQIMFPENFII